MNRELLQRGAERLGVPLDAGQLDRLAAYQRLLDIWGSRINLTAIRDPDEVVTHHFLDSLAVVHVLPAPGRSRTMLDVGSGAGFPGAVCALVRPDLRVTLVERVQKKAAFLLTLRRELGLGLEVRACDVREIRATFDVVVSRAAFPPERWIAVGAPLVAAGGLFLAMVGVGAGPLDTPPGMVQVEDWTYDVGAGPRRLVYWRVAVDT